MILLYLNTCCISKGKVQVDYSGLHNVIVKIECVQNPSLIYVSAAFGL